MASVQFICASIEARTFSFWIRSSPDEGTLCLANVNPFEQQMTGRHTTQSGGFSINMYSIRCAPFWAWSSVRNQSTAFFSTSGRQAICLGWKLARHSDTFRQFLQCIMVGFMSNVSDVGSSKNGLPQNPVPNQIISNHHVYENRIITLLNKAIWAQCLLLSQTVGIHLC